MNGMGGVCLSLYRPLRSIRGSHCRSEERAAHGQRRGRHTGKAWRRAGGSDAEALWWRGAWAEEGEDERKGRERKVEAPRPRTVRERKKREKGCGRKP